LSGLAGGAVDLEQSGDGHRAHCSFLQFFIGVHMPHSSSQAETFLGLPKLPARYASLVMPLILSVFMTFIVSMVSTLRGIGLTPDFFHVWLDSWGISWVVAYPTLLLVLPLVKRATLAVVRTA
jgi:hypothetical protein